MLTMTPAMVGKTLRYALFAAQTHPTKARDIYGGNNLGAASACRVARVASLASRSVCPPLSNVADIVQRCSPLSNVANPWLTLNSMLTIYPAMVGKTLRYALCASHTHPTKARHIRWLQ
jgi:hypothetical protein